MNLITLSKIVSELPLVVLHGFGWLLGWFAYSTSASYRRLFKEMLAQAIGAQHPEFHQILRKSVGETGKGLLELPYVWFRSSERCAAKKVFCDDWHVIEKYHQENRPILFLTPHMGCFEVAAQALALRIHITVLYRPNRNPAMQTMIENHRGRQNLELAPTDISGVRKLMKALKRHQAVGILPDQVPSNGEGVWVPSWGRPAYTMVLPAKLQKQSNAVVVMAVAARLPWGRGWRLRFIDVTAPLPESTEEATAFLNKEIERVVMMYPEQYYWAYDRYKVPAGVLPPENVFEKDTSA